MKRAIRAACGLFLLHPALTQAVRGQSPGVTLKTAANNYILQNAFVTAEVDRRTGDLKSLKYRDLELMGFSSGHHAGYWEQNPSGAAQLTDGISIDPAANAGDRAEVFVKGVADGKPITRTSSGNGMVCDLEIRYSLGRDDHGIYAYAIFSHPAGYPATDVGESRFGAKLSSDFDWLSIDAKRNLLMPTGFDWDHGQQLNMKEARRLTTGKFTGKFEHKYDYSADQFDIPAFGWSSTTRHVGLYFVNPSVEFLSGGPTHVELTGHLDDGEGGDPTLLDYWRGTHYGGTSLPLAKGEDWAKVIGPILVYVNSGDTPQAMYADALAEAKRQQSMWPFAWVKGIPYAGPGRRGAVSGKLSVKDVAPIPPGRMLVGLIPPGEEDGSWQKDSKHYQFWVVAGPDGSFTIPNVIPGSYMLHALSDGVLGEFNGPKLTVEPARPTQLAALTWEPIRYGKQLWEIGIPDRSGAEFFTGDKAARWGNYLLYAKLFPHDIHYVVGSSDFRKDWFYEQVPNVANGRGGQGNRRPPHRPLRSGRQTCRGLRQRQAGGRSRRPHPLDLQRHHQPRWRGRRVDRERSGISRQIPQARTE